MIATRSAMTRAAGVNASKHVKASAGRPLTVAVRAFKDDAATKQDCCCSPAKDAQQQLTKQQQQQQQTAVAPRQAQSVMCVPSVFHEMQREMNAMSRLFGLPSMALFPDDLFLSRAPQLELPAVPSMMRVAVDVEENDKAYVIKADTPGIPKDSLKLSVLDGTLTISGERREEKREGGEEGEGGAQTPLRFERSYGSFSRSFSLPPNVDVEAISAEARDGVLTVTLPKVPEVKPTPKEIEVN